MPQEILIQLPTIGRIVHCKLSIQDINEIRADRDDNYDYKTGNCKEISNKGSELKAGRILPMIVTKIGRFGLKVIINGQVFLDGNHTL